MTPYRPFLSNETGILILHCHFLPSARDGSRHLQTVPRLWAIFDRDVSFSFLYSFFFTRVTKFSAWNGNVWCRRKLPNWNASQRFFFLSAFPNFQRFSWNLSRASWLSWLDDLKMLTSVLCCTSRSVSSPWWASSEEKEASESWTSRLEVREFAGKSKGKTLYPLIKDGTTKTTKRRTYYKFEATAINGSGRFPIARHRWEPSSLRCVTRMLRNSTAQK